MLKHLLKDTSASALAALLALALGAAAQPAAARDIQAGSLTITDPWARATPKGAAVGGGYLGVTNTGAEPDTLIGGSLVDAGHVEVHEMTMEDGVMRMHPVAGGLVIKPGETVRLAPGGYHVMFMDMKRSLVKGEAVAGTLVFQRAGIVPVTFAVEGLGATRAGGDDATPR